MQALNSLTTVVHLALFAIVVPRAFFDDYSVWFTASMFAIGVGQAIGSERVVIGRRSYEDGARSAWSLALLILLVQVGMAVWLQSPVLAMASIGIFLWVVWDYLRIVQGFEEAPTFLRRDATVVVVQVLAVVAGDLAGLPGQWLAVVWWGVGSLLWCFFIGRMGLLGASARRGGFRVLWADHRESAPLFFDAALAGIPIVLALAVARSQADEGVASAARMAFTLLGPVAVLGIAGRRIVYQARSQGGFTPRTRAMFTAAIGMVFAVCFLILTLTRTPLYPLVLPGFAGLAWLAILGFAVNHSSVMAALLPAADLRAEKRTVTVGLARVVATLTAGAFVLLDRSFDSVTDVAWCVATSSIAYALVLVLAQMIRPTSPSASPAAADVEAVA